MLWQCFEGPSMFSTGFWMYFQSGLWYRKRVNNVQSFAKFNDPCILLYPPTNPSNKPLVTRIQVEAINDGSSSHWPHPRVATSPEKHVFCWSKGTSTKMFHLNFRNHQKCFFLVRVAFEKIMYRCHLIIIILHIMEETRKRWYFMHQNLASYVDIHLKKTCLKNSLQKKTDIGLPKVTPVKKKLIFKIPQVIQAVTFSSPNWKSLNPLKGSLNHPKKITLNCIFQIVAVDGAEALLGLRLYQTFIHFGTVEEWLLCLFLCRRVPTTTSYKCKPKLDVCTSRWITYLVYYISGFSPTTKKYQNTTAPWVEWSQRHHSHRHHGPDLSKKTRKGHLERQDYYRGLSTSQGKVKERIKL